ncbi:MAG: ubiquitin-protein ligase E3 RBBP6 family involved in mRNA cleavage [Amphiamblys sp. WSBS2006]|nr:MAG: ubiquitin-protein ligase E3 RBBP6 family involved in mRNA cleavage [Amphiamblys sp. WSBS2006]
MGVIHYKFKSEKDFKQIRFDGGGMSLLEMKNEIARRENLGVLEDYDLVIKNTQTGEEYREESGSVLQNTSVTVRRIPSTKEKLGRAKMAQVLASKGKRIQENKEKVQEKMSSGIHGSVDIGQTEEERIQDMIAQSGEMFGQQSDIIALNSSANPERFRSKQTQLPANYICFTCGKRGHLNKNCDSTAQKNFARVKKTTGIPKNLLRPIGETEERESALITPEGTFVTACADEEAWKVALGKREKANVDEAVVPADLKCISCGGVLYSPVLLPCCKKNICEGCVQEGLANSTAYLCPECKSAVRPEQLKVDREVKGRVERFLRDEKPVPSRPEDGKKASEVKREETRKRPLQHRERENEKRSREDQRGREERRGHSQERRYERRGGDRERQRYERRRH